MVSAKKNTWILIADGMRARVLKWEGGDRFVPALDRELFNPLVHGTSRDLKSDKPGRTFSTGSPARHAFEPRHDPHELEKQAFGRHVAELIEEFASRGAFDQLVLVAPPKALGILRAALGPKLAKRVIGEVHKDLVRTPVGKLAAHLRGVLGK